MEPIDDLNLDTDPSYTSPYRLRVWLGRNPWHCNESFFWLYVDLKSPDKAMIAHLYYRNTSLRIAIADHYHVECHTPYQFKGTKILAICKHTRLIHQS